MTTFRLLNTFTFNQPILDLSQIVDGGGVVNWV